MDFINFNYIKIPEFYVLVSKKINKNQKNINLHFATGGKILQQYVNLEILNCKKNNIVCDKDIKCENTLKKLDCRYNLNFTDDSISYLTNLCDLKCNKNFTDESISKLLNLTYLDCNVNLTDKFIKKFMNFNYSNCNMNITDNSISKLTNLTYLNCNKNITDNSISKLTNLEKLYFSYNKNITDESISNLTKLCHLTCNMNITDKSISKLTNLTLLNFEDNENITFQNLFKEIKNLRYLFYNSINSISAEVLEKLHERGCFCLRTDDKYKYYLDGEKIICFQWIEQ